MITRMAMNVGSDSMRVPDRNAKGPPSLTDEVVRHDELGGGCLMLSAWCWVLSPECWVLGAGCRVFDIVYAGGVPEISRWRARSALPPDEVKFGIAP